MSFVKDLGELALYLFCFKKSDTRRLYNMSLETEMLGKEYESFDEDKLQRKEVELIILLGKKYGAKKTEEILNDFSSKYKVKHHHDFDFYRGLVLTEAFNKYHSAKVEHFKRRVSLYYGVRGTL